MKYRDSTPYSEKEIADYTDGKHYNSLRSQYVTIGGEQQHHKFFSSWRDVALGLSTDGFAPFKRWKKTAWPLILFNYNLGPEVRNHQKHIISLGVIPGPNKPHDLDSFLYPLIEELAKLACGVLA